MMTLPGFALFLVYLFLGKTGQATELKFSSPRQEMSFVSAQVGDKVTLQCFYGGDVSSRIYWYKQTLGERPRLISSYLKYNINVTFHNEFINNPRFRLDTDNNKNHLTITDLRPSDSATYNCVSHLLSLEFYESIFVSVKGSGLNIPDLVHQPSASETIQPGGSVTLNCTVLTGTCDGEHSVYWFRNSGESHPGLIYTYEDRSDQCERKPNTQTQTCVYSLPMKSLNRSHAGTYYCAVASCGHILFGNGTRLDFKDEVENLMLVYFLSGALTFTCILVVLLLFIMSKMMRRNSSQTTESQVRFRASSTANAEDCQEANNLHYAALSIKQPNRSKRQGNNINNECVYSSVRQ